MKKLLGLGLCALLLSGCSSNSNTQSTASPSPEVDMYASPAASGSPSSMMDDAGNALNQAKDNAQDALDQMPNIKTVILLEQNKLGQSGTAVIAPTKDGKVQVSLTMKGGNFTSPQPAHIHVGSCPNPGAVKYPLTNVVNGKSETTLNVTMDDLLKSSDKLAVNVHKSAQESSVYTACGDVK
jgi:hypothetical protein